MNELLMNVLDEIEKILCNLSLLSRDEDATRDEDEPKDYEDVGC